MNTISAKTIAQKAQTMIRQIGLWTIGLLFLIVMPVANAQSPSDDWTIPQIECGEGCLRTQVVDEAGNLYIYMQRHEPLREVKLYVIRRGSEEISEYDLLQLYAGKLGVRTHLAPFASGRVVVFNYQGTIALTLLDLTSQTVTPLYVDVQGGIQECNVSSSITLAPSIYRVGEDGVLFCSRDNGINYLNLAYLENNQLTLSYSVAMGGSVTTEQITPTWRYLTSSLDGKIYVVPYPGSPILESVAPQYAHYENFWNYPILRFNPATTSWDMVFIEADFERWVGQNISTFWPLSGVDVEGNLYFAYRDVAHPEVVVSDLVKYDPQGYKIWHLTEADFDGQRFANPMLLGENQFILSFGNFDLRYEIEEEVIDFKIIDETNAPVAPITKGMIINLADYPTETAIRAKTAPEIVDSVLFDLNGTMVIDNEAPYTLPLPTTGAYTLTATPYAEEDSQGEPEVPLSVTFEVIGSGITCQPTAPADPPTYTVTAGDTTGLIATLGAQDTAHYISQLSWKSDGSALAVGYGDGSIELVNSTTGTIEQTMTGEHMGAINVLAWHPTANQLVSASVDRFLLWDLATGNSYELSPASWISAATWNIDGSQIVGFSTPGRITWKSQILPPLFLSIDGDYSDIHTIVWSPNRDQVATTVLGNVILRNPLTLVREVIVGNGGNGELAWSPDGEWLAASNWVNGIRMWNVSTGDFQQERLIQSPVYDNVQLHEPFRDIKAIHFSASGTELLSLTGYGIFTRWDVATGQILESLQLSDTPLYEATFSPDGTQLAYGTETGDVSIKPVPENTGCTSNVPDDSSPHATGGHPA